MDSCSNYSEHQSLNWMGCAARRKTHSPQGCAEMGTSQDNNQAHKVNQSLKTNDAASLLDIGSLVLDLTDAWAKHAQPLEAKNTYQPALCPSPRPDALSEKAVPTQLLNDSTRRAHAYLKSLLDTSESRLSLSSESASQELPMLSPPFSACSGRSSSDVSMLSTGSFYTP